ncbi:MAG: Gfo/Idh/MocA family oxidoreductase [Myxococcota bacterium]|nr:Gfo/Idh/MocA family oxidoreductase [Myxococcota bacterium]
MTDAPVRFAVIGIDHPHVYSMVPTLLAAGFEFAAFHAEGAPAEGFGKIFPMARRVGSPEEILEDGGIALVASSILPERRAEVAISAMQHGKDVLMDKPGAISLEELERVRAVQAESGQRYVIFYSERLENRATERACELVRSGAIGRPLQTIGLGPHRVGVGRPDWFWDARRCGGILGDLASHQVEQFLWITGSDRAEVVSAQVANHAHPDAPRFEDFGELLLRAPGASGYVRVDWFTPEGLGTWGDVRLTILGSEGTIEVRKNCDLAGREGGDHLFLFDGEAVRHEACQGLALPFGPALLRDVVERTEQALPQAHCFLAQELALRAQEQAGRITSD